MVKLYMISLSATLDREKVINLLDKKGLITYWFYSMPSSFFAESMSSAVQISQAIDAEFKNPIHFVGEISKQNFFGRMEKEHWKPFYKHDLLPKPL